MSDSHHVLLTIPFDLLAQLDNWAAKEEMTRSAAIRYAVRTLTTRPTPTELLRLAARTAAEMKRSGDVFLLEVVEVSKDRTTELRGQAQVSRQKTGRVRSRKKRG